MTPSFIRVAQRLLPASVRQHFADAIGRLNSEQRLDDKWLADSRALDIDERLRPLHRTIHSFAWSELRRFPNLTAPENFNDRIHWLMLFDQRELAIQCSDKKGVRDFVEERVGGEHLTELYACYDTAEQFEASTLPTRCAVKTSHDSGSVFLSTSQSPIQPVDILAEIRVALATQYGTHNGEWPYALVKPCILVEELLEQPGCRQPPDIKFHCVDGKVAFIHYICDRDSEPQEIIMTPSWELLPVRIYFPVTSRELPRPANLEELIRVAEAVSAGFKYVRVDLYNLDSRIIVGELTFFPMAGTYSGYGVYQIESRMRFDLTTRLPPISDGQVRFA